MKKRKYIPPALLCIFVLAFLISPALAGLTITEADTITTTDGATSSLITVTEEPIDIGGTITINVSGLNEYVAMGALTNDNVIITSYSASGTWRGEVEGNNLTLTSYDGPTVVDETITVTFTGAANPWVADLISQATLLTATRNDGFGEGNFYFRIETAPPGGLSITDGEKITTTDGSTSLIITITNSPIVQDGTISMDVSYLNYFLANGPLTADNVIIDDTAAGATWTREVTSDDSGTYITLISSSGSTSVNETVILTFTGAASPWVADTGGIDWEALLTAIRTDTGQTDDFTVVINITPPLPGGLTITDGAVITSPHGTSSPIITITDSPMAQDGTITIDIRNLNQYVSGYTFTTENIAINDDAANATWTRAVEGNILTLTSSGGPTTVGETVTLTFTGAAGNSWIPNTGGLYTVPLTASRNDGLGACPFNFLIQTGGLAIAKGEKIIALDGATSLVITITDSDISPDDTIGIDISTLNQFIASGIFTDDNVVINDTAVAAQWTGAIADNVLTLTSSGGTTVVNETVTVTFTGAGANPWKANTGGNKTVTLSAIRNDGLGGDIFDFVIETTPPSGPAVHANFSAYLSSDVAPLTVAFTDTSLGNPTSWIWNFGDNFTSIYQNPVHTYIVPGTYTVSLKATNAYGFDTKTQADYITVLIGALREVNTSIAGLTVTNCGGPQSITVDTSILPTTLTPNNSVLEVQPDAGRGFKNITIYAFNGAGFSRNGDLISGEPTGIHFVTEDIAPLSGFSSQIGTNSSFSYSIDLTSYPCNALLSTKILEGAIPEYDTKFQWIASNNSAFPLGTAYTATITKTNFPSDSRVKLLMSVDSNLNEFFGDPTGRIFIWRISDDKKSGQILPTRYLYSDSVNNLDYFEADSPLGLSTFGISSVLTDNNNPFQLIVFAIEAAINPGNPADGQSSQGNSQGGGGGSGANKIGGSSIPPPNASAPPDPGRTAKIYANANAVVTQASSLHSTDGFATVNIGTGIVARDTEGKPLSSITIKAISEENLPGSSPGTPFSYAGRTYELQPDGATFSPEILINLTVPNIQFGQELMVKMYDNATDTWEDVPTSTDPKAGTITAQISHFCYFALFAKTVTMEPESANTPEPTKLIPKAVTPAPTAMSTFVGMLLWLADLIQKNTILFMGILVLAVGIFLFGRKRRRDRLMYLF